MKIRMKRTGDMPYSSISPVFFWHYKIFCVNVKYGTHTESRILHLHKIVDSALFIQYNQDLFHHFFHCAALLDYIDTFLQTIQTASYLYTSQSIYFNRSVGSICTHTCNRRTVRFYIQHG